MTLPAQSCQNNRTRIFIHSGFLKYFTDDEINSSSFIGLHGRIIIRWYVRWFRNDGWSRYDGWSRHDGNVQPYDDGWHVQPYDDGWHVQPYDDGWYVQSLHDDGRLPYDGSWYAWRYAWYDGWYVWCRIQLPRSYC
ncbi:hypothetical protein LOTGIDRAFT_233534 [Lottia gigantea]|uniref:Uncharacterized protein n=1 Tax=Lottia gigantea TaxID=225164 RepID=V4BQB4_LOTGI|nr:hypothetical protein LOTGIDRAFT_233534 [Lottia gigantea]ESO91059.1 hypothetical protein LOTGIDRAFT_233534 [Lottia gigantea]